MWSGVYDASLDATAKHSNSGRTLMAIRTVGVLGCGLRGSGIAQVCAASGYKTIVREVDDTVLQKGLGRIKKFLDDGVTKGKVTPEARDKTLANLSGATTFEALKGCDIVIE